jgi:hypothetical protein
MEISSAMDTKYLLSSVVAQSRLVNDNRQIKLSVGREVYCYVVLWVPSPTEIIPQ